VGRAAAGDEIGGRRLLMWNEDVEISLCRPAETMESFYRNGEGDEVVFVHEGTGTLETDLRQRALPGRRLRRDPRGTTYRFAPEGEQRHLVFESPA